MESSFIYIALALCVLYICLIDILKLGKPIQIYAQKICSKCRSLIKKEEEKPSPSAPTAAETQLTCERTFKELHIPFKLEAEDGNLTYNFRYQSGNFMLCYSKSHAEKLRIIYPGIDSASIDDIDAVRTVCNQINQQTESARLFYTIVGERNEVNLHIDTHEKNITNVKALAQAFALAFETCFSCQRFANDMLENIRNQQRQAQGNDMEYSYHQKEALENAILEQQVNNDSETIGNRGHIPYDAAVGLTVGRWLDTMSFLTGCTPATLECYADGQYLQVKGEKEVRSFVLLDAVRQGNEAPLLNKAMLRISYYPFDAMVSTEGTTLHSLVFNLTALHTNQEAAFYQLDYLLPQMDAGEHESKPKTKTLASPQSGSMLIAVDLQSEQKAQAEFRFMWNDAHDKQKENRLHELTDIQKVLTRLSEVHEGYYLYWGTRFLREKRYLEASLMLKEVWHRLNDSYPKLSPSDTTLFLDTSYWIASCLFHLKLYRQAYFFIDICEQKSQTNYVTLMVKCLMAMHDHRALVYVRKVKEEVEQSIHQLEENGEETPVGFARLRKFLRQSEVLLLIDMEKFNTASKRCNEMLLEPDYQDFAINQLTQIERLKMEIKIREAEANALSEANDSQPSVDSSADSGPENKSNGSGNKKA